MPDESPAQSERAERFFDALVAFDVAVNIVTAPPPVAPNYQQVSSGVGISQQDCKSEQLPSANVSELVGELADSEARSQQDRRDRAIRLADSLRDPDVVIDERKRL